MASRIFSAVNPYGNNLPRLTPAWAISFQIPLGEEEGDIAASVKAYHGVERRSERRTMNELVAIYPYKHHGLWVFDDERVGLVQEPFVSGADTIIDRMTQHISGAEDGFLLLFSANPFPGSMAVLEWRREEFGGNWYYSADLDIEGWLCPALLGYFYEPPKALYAKFEAKDV